LAKVLATLCVKKIRILFEKCCQSAPNICAVLLYIVESNKFFYDEFEKNAEKLHNSNIVMKFERH
jgi:hypothetical protein